jgi:hypothetical protein
MMAKLGYKPGEALGKEGGRLEPLELSVKEGRGGIGHDSERKRKFREEVAREAEEVEKKRKLEEERGVGYRERVAMEREEKRLEGLWWGAMKVGEGLEEHEVGSEYEGPTMEEKKKNGRRKRRVNFLWGALDRERRTKAQEKLAQRNVLSRLTDAEEDDDDRLAYEVEVEEDLEDPELDAYLELPVKKRLEKLVAYLRERWWYCFWCKHKYEQAGLPGCPGTNEEDHD